MSLSVCYIVKNEEKTLRKSLESVSDIADEIIIADTGSTDKSFSIAKQFPHKNVHLCTIDWNNDFSNARNLAISQCTKDWILILDGDECFYEHNVLQKLMSNEKVVVWEMVQLNHSSRQMCRQFRLFRNHYGIGYNGVIHETINCTGLPCGKSDVCIIHYPKEMSANEHGAKLKNIIESIENNDLLKQSYYKGIHYLRTGKHAKAIEYLNRCVKQLEPGLRAFVYLQAGALYMDIAKMYEAEALKNYSKSFEHAPNQNSGHIKLFEYMKRKGLFNNALQQLEILSKRNQKLSDMQNDICFTNEFINNLKSQIKSEGQYVTDSN